MAKIAKITKMKCECCKTEIKRRSPQQKYCTACRVALDKKRVKKDYWHKKWGIKPKETKHSRKSYEIMIRSYLNTYQNDYSGRE